MKKKVVPMIHVPDVRATVDWYESIGFRVIAAYGNESESTSSKVHITRSTGCVKSSFKPIAFDGATIIFNVEDGETVGLTFIQDGHENKLKRL